MVRGEVEKQGRGSGKEAGKEGKGKRRMEFLGGRYLRIGVIS